MKIKLYLGLVSLLAVIALILGSVQAGPVSAATGTATVHIVKYAADRETVLSETTASIADLESGTNHPPVQGDGVTHYYTEGPTLSWVPPEQDIWDPGELCPGDSLKDKGALKGTALKDLCDLVGGAADGDQVNVKASDGYNETFDYTNVYNTLADPGLNARQGPMVICWWKDGLYSGSGAGKWSDGMLLAFFTTVPSTSANPAVTGKLLFGHQDMQDCLPQHNWHYYYQGSIQYPSTHGLSIKYISEISVYSGGVNDWSVTLTGARNDNLTQTWFENGLACHLPGGPSTYIDGQGNTWSGFPLWYICGLVDDENIHGPGAFNTSLYYDVKVTAVDDYSYTFPSTTVCGADKNDYILANKVKLAGEDEFQPLPEGKYPLKLVSNHFSAGGQSVAQIKRIDLLNISETPPSPTPTPTPGEADWPLLLEGAVNYNVTQAYFESGVSHHGAATYTDEENNVWSGLPLWLLVGYVDDDNMHGGAGAFNDDLVSSNYRVKVIAADDYYQIFDIADVARNNNIFVANRLNGAVLPANTGEPGAEHPCYPLKIVGSDVSSGSRVGAIVKIQLLDLPSIQPAWDLNGDHRCNIGDVVAIGLHWGQTGESGWIPEDLNKDGAINIADVTVLGMHWNQTW